MAILSCQDLRFNNIIVALTPDFHHGSHPADLDLRARKDLGNDIVPYKQLEAPLLPIFFLRARGPKESPVVLKHRATRDATYRACGLLEIHSDSKSLRLNGPHFGGKK